MKRLLLATVSIIIWALTAVAQTAPCPSVSVEGPSDIMSLGQPEIFTVNLGKEAQNYKIKYRWTVSSDGKLIEGQGTNTIKVVRLERGTTITATVDIGGLPEGCSSNGSASGETDCGPPPPIIIDEFSLAPPRIFKERLESIAKRVQEYPTHTLYFSERFKRGISRSVIKLRLERMFSYLIKNLGIAPERVKIQVFDDDKNVTRVWLVPEGADEPEDVQGNRIIYGETFQKQLGRQRKRSKLPQNPSKIAPSFEKTLDNN